jgi:myo-inositol 2-dehydrogenase / D-chiro-inositol 1-dehydrogenase
VIRAGVIGTGGISGVHLSCLKSRADVQVAALCDILPEALARRQEEFGGKGFAAFGQMLDDVKLDAVWLCTPPQVREGPLLACARRGIPVFCEKPVERSASRGAAIARALRNLGARVQVGYVFRSMPVVARLIQEMEGDVVHAVQSFYGCGVSLDRSLRAWFYDQSLSGGAIVDQATHNLDLLRRLFGEVEQVTGIARNPVHAKEKGYTIDEVISLSLAFRAGMVASHTHTWVGDAWRNELNLVGEKRRYRLDLGRRTLVVEEGEKSRSFTQDEASIYTWENEVFLSQVSSGDWSANPCTYDDGQRTLELTRACSQAVETGKAIKVRPGL